LAKGNAKGALKDAVLCHRQEASPENQALLERTYLARIEQLLRLKQTGDARGLLARLDDLGVSTPAVAEQLPRLRLLVGDRRVDPAVLCAQNPTLAVELADRAVLDATASAPLPGLAEGVRAVRAALEAIERGEDEAAVESLREIPRDSPLSQWKLLARGLSAFYRRDRQRMQDNWQRLDASRPPYRIAQTLLIAGGELPREQGQAYAGGVRRLEAALQGSPAADVLQKLAGCWRDNEWHKFFDTYRAFRQRYAANEGPLLEKIVELVVHRAVRERAPRLLERVMQIGPPPAQDPKWNRARAMMEESLNRPDVTPLERHWLAYAEDLAKLPSLRSDEKGIAAGLVYARLARHFVRFGDESRMPAMFGQRDDESAERFWQRAEELFEEGLRRCPDVDDAYRDLAKLHADRDDEEASAAVWRRFVARRPDDYDAQLWLADYHLGRDEPADSQPHVDAARRLRPRDPGTTRLDWSQRITRIRCLTKKRKFDEARAEWQRAADEAAASSAGLMPIEPYTLDAMRAGIEFKAKQPEVAQQFVDAALGRVEEPTVIWLQMSSIAARYGLPREIKKDFDARYAAAIEQPPTSATIGRLAGLFATLKGHHVNYTGRATQERLLLKHLDRARRVAWREDDLVQVCLFLSAVPRQFERLKTLIEQGLKKFPESAYFHVAAANLEIAVGPWLCRRSLAIGHYRQALALLGKADRHRETVSATPEVAPAETPLQRLLRAGLVEQAQHGLSLLGDDGRPLEAFDDEFGFGGEDDDFDDDEFNGDDDGPFEFGGRSRGRRGGGSRGAASLGMPLFDENEEDDEEGPPGGDLDIPPGMPRELVIEFMTEAMLHMMPAALKREVETAAKVAGITTSELIAKTLADQSTPMGQELAKMLGAQKL
jgi:hypothetical protein